MESKYEIVDVWMQHPTKRFIEHPMFDSLRRWQKQGGQIRDVPLETTIAAMDQAGVNKGLLSAWYGPNGALISNEEVASFVERFPDRLIGIASVDLFRPVPAIHELRRCVHELGFKGLRIVQWLWGFPSDDRRYYPLYAECVGLGVPVCLQAGHTGPLRPSEPGRPIPYLDHVALEFPELKIVAGHTGYPWTTEMISLATKYPNVYIDTSAYKPSRYPQELIAFLRAHGRKKVLFGTNYPMITPHECLQQLGTLKLDDETERLFLCENAKNIFSLS